MLRNNNTNRMPRILFLISLICLFSSITLINLNIRNIYIIGENESENGVAELSDLVYEFVFIAVLKSAIEEKTRSIPVIFAEPCRSKHSKPRIVRVECKSKSMYVDVPPLRDA